MLCIWKGMWRVAVTLLAVPALLLSGCGKQETQKAIEKYRASSEALASAYQTFVAGANTVEDANYINRLVAARQPFDDRAMQSKHIFTPEEIALRGAAVKALGDYTATLASLEAGGSSADIEANAKTASASFATLATDSQTALGTQTGNEVVDFSKPVSTAIAAVGSVLRLMEEHRGRAVVKASILQNDAAVQQMFGLIERESRLLYQRQRNEIGEQRTVLVGAFDDEAKRPSGAGLVDLGERLKKMQLAIALQGQADPHAAIAAFQASHDALIKIIQDGEPHESTLKALIASAESLAAEVGPLAANVQAFVASL